MQDDIGGGIHAQGIREYGNETLAIKDSADKAVATEEKEEEEEEIPMKPPAKRKHGESTQSETLNPSQQKRRTRWQLLPTIPTNQ